MAHQLFQLPKQLNVSSNLTLLAGAKAYFYETLTVTPRDTFTTSALDVAHENPVQADAAGVFPAIYLNPALQYKLTLKTSAGVELYTEDPVNDNILSSDIIAQTLNSLKRTAAEIAAGVTPTDYAYPYGHILRYIPTAEHAAILAGTSSYDASADAQDWLDSLVAGMTATLVGVVRAQGLVLKISDIEFVGGGWLKPVSNASAATVIQIGDDSDNTLVRRTRGLMRIGDPAGSVSTWSNVTGLALVRCVELNIGLDFRGLGVGMALIPAESSVAYNQFHLGLLLNCKVDIQIAPTSGGAANENTFYGGRFALNTGEYEAGCIYVDIQHVGSNQPNNNRFITPSFENGAQYLKNAGLSIFIEDARFEPAVSGTPGTDFAETLIEHLSGSARCEVGFSHNSQWLSGNHAISHGAGTRVNDQSFTIAGVDVTPYFYPGAWAYVTIGGTQYLLPVTSSAFSTDTTVIVGNALITGNPTDVATARVKDSGAQNSLKLSRNDIPTVASMKSLVHQNLMMMLSRSALCITARGGDYPALTLGAGGSAADKVLSIIALNGEKGSCDANGNLTMATLKATGHLLIADGVGGPGTVAGYAQIYVDTADGDLKVKYGDGTIKTIVVDT